MKDGEEAERIISPHTLVCTPLRWHVRAYCEHSKGYRDFVLSRIRGIPDINDKVVMEKDEDKTWTTQLCIELKPDPRLTEAQAAIIANDYGMEKGNLHINTNAALIRYVLNTYNIDINVLDSNPKGQQIILGNFEELKQYVIF